jgi:methylmalonyl-CoA mutase cobalamin-binding subunit
MGYLQHVFGKETRGNMAAKILGGSLGECVHVAGILNFLKIAEEQGYHTEFTGPATSIAEYLAAAREVDPDILAVSYRLTPENAAILLADFKQACEEEGFLNKRFVFGGTPPVAEVARRTGLFEAVFSGQEPPEAVIAYLKGKPWEEMREEDYPNEVVERIRWKAPFPILRHHFGLPAETIQPTVEGIKEIAEAHVLDVVSLGPDQDAQQNFFHPERQDPRRKGAGGVPFRTEDDLRALYVATRRGNYPLMRSYSGTADLLRYAEVLRRTINNAWCATSLFWFNVMDGRGPFSLRESVRDHMALMRWHGERNIPVEGNEPYHWGLRDAHDAVICADSYIYAHVAKKMGVRDYITTYMFETPPHLSNRMDLAKALAQIELAESFANENFRIIRQTRTGLMSYPVDPDYARAQLAASVYLQMALRPSIVHVVGYCEADHAATAGEVIESCKMATKVIQNCLYGTPDMTKDPEVQWRKDELVEEAMVIVEAIQQLGGGRAGDPLTDPDALARAVEIGLLDAPQLKGNPYACGKVRTKIINGANYAVDEEGNILSEKERVKRLFAEL